MVFLSGKTGVQIGSTVVLDSFETANHLLHCTTEGSHYILLQKGLYLNYSWSAGCRLFYCRTWILYFIVVLVSVLVPRLWLVRTGPVEDC